MLSIRIMPAVGVPIPISRIPVSIQLLDTVLALTATIGLSNLPPVVWMHDVHFNEGPAQILDAVWMDGTPMRRMVEPEEVAAAIAFLASRAASGITGAVLTVDAGYTIW